MKVVVDASIVVKWLLPRTARQPSQESHVDESVELLETIRDGRISVVQPPHWLAEAAAVMTRLRPEIALRSVELLAALELPTSNDLEVYRRAVELGHTLKHHVFDTLYHAVALIEDATLVTADEKYWRKAQSLGALVKIDHFRLDSAPGT